MRHFLKTQTVSDLRNVPGGLFEQDLGLLYDPVADVLGGGFARVFFEHFVEMIDVDGQPVGIILSGT